jgi:hypothetical protein
MTSPTPITVFPPEIWSVINQWVPSIDIAKLLMTGSRNLAQKLSEGGVKDWTLQIGPGRTALHPWPFIAARLRTLKSFSIHWHLQYELPIELDATNLACLPKGLTKLGIRSRNVTPPFAISWEDITQNLPNLSSISLIRVELESEEPDFSGMQALETLELYPTDVVLQYVLPALPPSLTHFAYTVNEDTKNVSVPNIEANLPRQLRTLKFLASATYPQINIHLSLFHGENPGLPDSLTCFHLSRSFKELMGELILNRAFPPSLLELSIPLWENFPAQLAANPTGTVLPEGLTRLEVTGTATWEPQHVAKLPRSLTSVYLDSLDQGHGKWDFPPALEELTNGISAGWLEKHRYDFPSSIRSLKIYNESQAVIPILPEKLKSLDCRLDPCNAHLLPHALTFLDIYVPEDRTVTSLPPFPETLTQLECSMAQFYSLSFLPKTQLKRVRISCHSDSPRDADWYSHIPATVTSLQMRLNGVAATNEQVASLACMPVLSSLILDFDCNHCPSFTTAVFASLGPNIADVDLHVHHLEPANCPTPPRSLKKLSLHTSKAPDLSASLHLLSALEASDVGIFSMKPAPPEAFRQRAAKARICIL